MAAVNSRDGKLYLDFRYKGIRCREQTPLRDTAENRKKLEKVLANIEQQIKLGTFDYAHHFPNSGRVEKFRRIAVAEKQMVAGAKMEFGAFARLWLEEKRAEWRESHFETVEGILRCHLEPTFGAYPLGSIAKADILEFRRTLCHPVVVGKKPLSISRVNHIMTYLRLILNEGAERFEYESPWRNIKALTTPRSEVQPFSLQEVKRILENVRPDYAAYFTVRFFTGMRTGEIDGLVWKNIDFRNRKIHINQSLVRGKLGPAKTSGSHRSISMSTKVYEVLREHYEKTPFKHGFVFCSRNGEALNHRNVTNRVWYPLLRNLGLPLRNPYQTRHTAATLWLAAGENPEWIARQLGHANTSMLFKVYSRYIPNLMGRDGASFERLLEQNDE